MKVVKKKKFIRPSLATPEQSHTLAERKEREKSEHRRTRRRRRTSSTTSDSKGSSPRIARNQRLETMSCEQRSSRIVHALLQAAAVVAALGVAFLSYKGYTSGSEGAWVGVLGALALFAMALFSIKKMREPSDWDQSHLRAKGEKKRRRRSDEENSDD